MYRQYRYYMQLFLKLRYEYSIRDMITMMNKWWISHNTYLPRHVCRNNHKEGLRFPFKSIIIIIHKRIFDFFVNLKNPKFNKKILQLTKL